MFSTPVENPDLEPTQTCFFFAKIVNGHQSSNTFAKRSVLDV